MPGGNCCIWRALLNDVTLRGGRFRRELRANESVEVTLRKYDFSFHRVITSMLISRHLRLADNCRIKISMESPDLSRSPDFNSRPRCNGRNSGYS
jgi:hypothetical protein